MKAFISYIMKERDLIRPVVSALKKNNIEISDITNTEIEVGMNFERTITEELYNCDVFIAFISDTYAKSHWATRELLTVLSFNQESTKRLILPIIFGDEVQVPIFLENYIYLRVDEQNNVDYVTNKIIALINAHEQKLNVEKEEQRRANEKVKTSLSAYISEVFIVLKESEKNNKYFAIALYSLSIVTFLVSIIFLVLTYNNSDNQDIFYLGTIVVKNIVVTALLIALARLFFVLGKSFMVESIRKSDRIHAISFGKFFLDAFGESATREEIINAFSSWNIDAGSTFRTQSTEEFDPKIIEILKLLKKD